MLEPRPAGVDDLDADLALVRPVDVLARRQDPREPAVDPDQRALAVLQVEHLGEALQLARLDDQVELKILSRKVLPVSNATAM